MHQGTVKTATAQSYGHSGLAHLCPAGGGGHVLMCPSSLFLSKNMGAGPPLLSSSPNHGPLSHSFFLPLVSSSQAR